MPVKGKKKNNLPNLQNLWTCYFTWQKGIKIADEIKVANYLTKKRVF